MRLYVYHKHGDKFVDHIQNERKQDENKKGTSKNEPFLSQAKKCQIVEALIDYENSNMGAHTHIREGKWHTCSTGFLVTVFKRVSDVGIVTLAHICCLISYHADYCPRPPSTSAFFGTLCE